MKELKKTKDPVNQSLVEVGSKHGISKFGIMNNQVWIEDPKRIVFTMARYKFVSKMLSGYNKVLEIGCGDGFCSRIVKQEVDELTISDFDPLFINSFKDLKSDLWPIDTIVFDILQEPLDKLFDAIYSLDVLEHIEQQKEDIFFNNIKKMLVGNGVTIIGMPSLESQIYASENSKAGHINCKSGKEFKMLLLNHFQNVFIFSMNDEVVHTGFYPMAHYLIGLCVGKK